MPGRRIDRFSRGGGLALGLLVAGILAGTAGAAQGAPAHAAAKTQAVVVRGSGADRGTYEVIVGVRSRSGLATHVNVYLAGKAPHALVARSLWGARTKFRVKLTGKRLTVRAVSTPPGVDVRTKLVRVDTTPPTPAAEGQDPTSIPVSTPASTPTTTPTTTPPTTTPTTPPAPTIAPPTPPAGPYQTLFWQDDFTQDYATGGSAPNQLPNPSAWSFDTWGGCGDNTLSTNVAPGDPTASRYATLTPSGLALNAIETSPGQWTSAQIDTIGHHSFIPGSTIQARVYMPTGSGLCPAFWMVSDSTTNDGEIDIVEAPSFVGEQSPLTAFFTLHGPGPVSQQWEEDESSINLAGWHTYAITWSTNAITWSIDGTPYATATPSALIPGASWSTYISSFHIIFDLAVGGWPCSDDSVGPNCSPPSSATMYVQWVRAWT
ncbi:MAG TPA: glycoside hydrolase family 16 protein [Solirubrobacteraceae bacterium]|jgi:hypothetical protein|nr:glycoside hydrolase family 16 protein [Solirubrobacteraceae bacterium]